MEYAGKRGAAALAATLLLGACNSGGGAADQGNSAPSAATAPAQASTPAAAAFPPWKKDGDCYWVLTYPDGVAHRAWIGAGDGELVLSIVDDAIPGWPVSDALPLTLRAGASQVAAVGSHGEDDSATLLSIAIGDEQRALLAQSGSIEVLRDGRPEFELPLAGVPTDAELLRCAAG